MAIETLPQLAVSFRIDRETLEKLNAIIKQMEGPRIRGKRSLLLRRLIEEEYVRVSARKK